MRYLFIAGVLFFGLWVGTGNAEDAFKKEPGAATIVGDVRYNSEADEIDAEGNSNESLGNEGNVAGQSDITPDDRVYDENTGMPDVVPSDRDGEL